jgi:colanic acid biosynthesis glycosyl transferase WcaI
MKILYVSQYFPPEMGAPAARAGELSRHWARLGHDVTVLTGFPNHPTGVVAAEWRARLRGLVDKEIVDADGSRRGASPARGVLVVRTWLWPLPNRKAHERIRNYVSFCLSAAITGLDLAKPDVVVATSPQLLGAFSGWWLAWWKRVPFIFEIRDLWPESLAAVGAAREGSPLYRTTATIASFLYRKADHIVVVSPAFKDHLIRHWRVLEEKISIVENGVETDLFRFDSAAPELRAQLNLGDRFLICYIGTIGMAHGLRTLIAAAERLRTALPAALFLLIGEGADKRALDELAAARGLTNLRFLGQQPRARIPVHISAADICLVMLKKNDLFKTVIPTKLLEYMACERPVLVAVDGQARQIVEATGAGVFVEPEDSDALVQAIVDLAADPERRQRMGISGRTYILSQLSRERTAQHYLSVLSKVIDMKKREPR